MKKPIVVTGAMLMLATLTSLQPRVLAQEEGEDLGWSHEADFSLVLTAGNSETSTLGLNYTAQRKWADSLLTVRTGGLRAENSDRFFLRTVGGDMEVEETTTTAENYYFNGRYDQNITDRLFWYVGAGWMRNEFAGIKNRYTASAGVGNVWFDNEDRTLRTNYGISYTDQEDVFPPRFSDRYAGLLVGWNYLNKFGNSSQYGNDFNFNYSLDESSDWRWTMDQWIAVGMTETLALKVSLLWLYDNDPALGVFEVRQDTDGDPTTPDVPVDVTIAPLDELDTVFSVSLVVSL